MADCLFCRMVSGEIPCDRVYEDENVLAFRDIDPKAPVHILIIPKTHVDNIAGEGAENYAAGIFKAVRVIVAQEGLDEKGYRVVTNTGSDGGQSVGHLHFHLLGGRQLAWPPG